VTAATAGTRGWWGGVALAAALLSGGAPRIAAQASPAAASGAPVTRFIIVSGVSGEKRYADLYHAWTMAVAAAATARFGAPDSLVTVLAEQATRDPKRIRARSTRDNVLAAITGAARQSRAGDRIAIFLFGHGNTQDAAPRLNLPGPDATAADFDAALQPAKEATVLFVNTASGSGEFVKALSGANRIVVTATRSSREQNATIFPQHFIAALTSAAGDADKDGRVSILEAFTYARLEVERLFEQENRIATEHPLLDDDGDGVGHSDASEKGPDGARARSFHLEPLGGAAAVASSDPRVARLIDERRALEARIEALRGRRSALSEDAYQKALEPLMVELAEKTRALRALEGRKP